MRTFLIIVLITAVGIGAALGLAVTVAWAMPVQAAQPAPPEIKPCQVVNTATFASGVVIEVALCEYEGGLPYLLDSYGFMKGVE